MVDIDIRISSHLKEKLAWAVDKQLWIISDLNNTKELKGTKE